MEIHATQAATDVVERARAERDGRLSITLGTGCCDSTAPFLYENHLAGYDHEPAGNVAGVEVLANHCVLNSQEPLASEDTVDRHRAADLREAVALAVILGRFFLAGLLQVPALCCTPAYGGLDHSF